MGIKISDVSITKEGNDLLLTINGQDSILLKDTTENRVIERIMFADLLLSVSVASLPAMDKLIILKLLPTTLVNSCVVVIIQTI
jgi:hypothetical protein